MDRKYDSVGDVVRDALVGLGEGLVYTASIDQGLDIASDIFRLYTT